MRAHYAEARAYALSRLAALKDLGLRWRDPDGAFYVFVAVDALLPATAGGRSLKTSVDLAGYLLDACDLEDVAAASRARDRATFMLTINPLRLEGGTGSPVNPVATF